MNKVEKITGMVFGKWIALGEVFKKVTGTGKEYRFVTCRCECGLERDVLYYNLLNGLANKCRSCAARYSAKRHGKSGTPTYFSYVAMLSRCTNPADKYYHKYGGDGIVVCDRWLETSRGILNFIEDMGERPEGTTLNRINGAKIYSKETCEWATLSVQAYDTKLKKNNTSGKTGVRWDNDRWEAYIKFQKKLIHLGRFVNFEEAVNAREEAEIFYFGFNKL